MKIILDEGVPELLADYLAGHEASTVKRQGWRGIKNGRLLQLIGDASFDAFITADKRMRREQALDRCGFRILVLSTNHWPTLQLNIATLSPALDQAHPGTVTKARERR